MADNHQKRLLLFVTLFSSFICSSFGYQFLVGGRDGWIVNPNENYNHWAERNRFQVNDTLLFQYKKESNSVLVVKKDDYDKCNTGNPILKLDDGNSVFKFDRSGPFYFISGNKANCDQGQKLIIVVLAVRSPPPHPRPPTVVSPPTAPSPNGSAGSSISPPFGAPTPATSPSSPSPSGGAPTPAPSPSGGAPTPAPSPASEAPGPATSPSSPTPASEAPGLSPADSNAPSSSITPGAPGSSTPGSPESSTPGSGSTGNVSSPPPRRSLAAQSGTPSIVLSSLVMSVVLGGFMV